MKNSNDTIGNRNRHLLTCSAVPQPTAPPRSPKNKAHLYYIIIRASLKKTLQFLISNCKIYCSCSTHTIYFIYILYRENNCRPDTKTTTITRFFFSLLKKVKDKVTKLYYSISCGMKNCFFFLGTVYFQCVIFEL